MSIDAQVEPHVLFPVFWPADSTPPDIAAWVCHCLKMHIVHAQAVAEIARRNGGGGHLRVELTPGRWDHAMDGSRYTGAIAEGQWTRERLELSANVSADDADALRAGPTQRCFTAQVEIPNGTAMPDVATARVECTGFHANALRTLEARGLDKRTAVLAAMDGGNANALAVCGRAEP